MSKKVVLLLSILLVLLIGMAAILGVLMITEESGGDKYRKKMAAANKYIQEENWDDAIVAYLDAIELNKNDEEAYHRLAEIYLYQGRMDEARGILERGLQFAASTRLQDLYDYYFVKTPTTTQIKDTEQTLELNTTLLGQFASYTYGEYLGRYGLSDITGSESLVVTHRNLKDVRFEYYNTETNSTIINTTSGEPNSDKMPWKIKLDDLSVLISGISDGVVSYDELESLGVANLRIGHEQTIDSDVVIFEVSRCKLTIACDENGSIKTDSWNQLEPMYGNAERDENDDSSDRVLTVESRVCDAQTGNALSGATVSVRDFGMHSGNVIQSVQTREDGGFSMDLEEGSYTAEIRSDGFIPEFIDFDVDDEGDDQQNTLDLQQFVISPILNDGEIRIVLEWGSYPRDLDSHLEGTDSNGNNIHIAFYNRVESAANLDVDDTDGFGPETTTILDINGDYEFYVYDYNETGNISSSGAVVKIYVAGQETPLRFEVPAGIQGNTWRICKISQGVVTAE